MSQLARACVSIAAIGCGLTVSCTKNTLNVCDTTNKGQCTAENLKVLSPRLCQTQDWALRAYFANIDLNAFATIPASLDQAASKASLPIVLRKDTQVGVYSATVKQASLQPFRGGSATLSVDNEPGFGSQKITINRLFNPKKVTQDYVDPGTVGIDGKPTIGTFPWPERVGVSPDGGVVVLNEGVDIASGYRAWKVLHLQYDKAKELSIMPTFLFGGARLATMLVN